MQKLNWIKIIPVGSFLIIALSLAYYFLVFTPKKYDEQNNAQCAQSGSVFYQNYKAQQSYLSRNVPDNGIYSDPVFHYNEKLSACLVFITENDGVLQSIGVYNVNSNINIAQSTVTLSNNEFSGWIYDVQSGQNKALTDENEFEKSYNQLMND